MGSIEELLERPVYGFQQVDRLLLLRPGTAERWIDGYERRGHTYPPVVRDEKTGDDIVTWGEFVESRFLAEYRNKGVPIVNMRPAILRMKERFGLKYPLAHLKPFAFGKELVEEVQEEVGLESALRMVVIRSGQYLLTDPAQQFINSVDFGREPAVDNDSVVQRLHPLTGSSIVMVDPLRQFGEPVVRSVPTTVIAELFDAGDSVEAIADLYDLGTADVEAALRYEREQDKASAPSAA
jgi:uncharacterized protein (DUF433 family)